MEEFEEFLRWLLEIQDPISLFTITCLLSWLMYLLVPPLFRLMRQWAENIEVEEDHPRRPPRGRVAWLRRRPPPPRIRLSELSLIIRKRQDPQPYRRGRLLNPNQDGTMRPLAIIEVNDPELVNRPLPVEFKLLDPKGAVKYKCSFDHELTQGTNRIFPEAQEWPVRRRSAEGQWKLLLWVAGRRVKSQPILIAAKLDALIEASVSPDMELTAKDERIADQLEGLSIDDLMKL